MRRYGEAIKAGQIYHPRPGVYAVLLAGSDLLVTHQSNPIPEYQLPGGGVDPGEHPIAALHREVFEETGWRMAITRRMGAFRRFTYMPDYDRWAEKICVIYLARPIRLIGAPSEAGHTAVWIKAPQGLTLLGNEGDRAFLARALRGQTPR